MSYNLIIRPEAELDIQDAFEWYETQVPGLGSEFVRAVDKPSRFLENHEFNTYRLTPSS